MTSFNCLSKTPSTWENGPYEPIDWGYQDQDDWPIDNYKVELWDDPEGGAIDSVELNVVDPNV